MRDTLKKETTMKKSVDLRVAEKLVKNREEDLKHSFTSADRKDARRRLADARRHLHEVITREPGYEAVPISVKK